LDKRCLVPLNPNIACASSRLGNERSANGGEKNQKLLQHVQSELHSLPVMLGNASQGASFRSIVIFVCISFLILLILGLSHRQPPLTRSKHCLPFPPGPEKIPIDMRQTLAPCPVGAKRYQNTKNNLDSIYNPCPFPSIRNPGFLSFPNPDF